MLKTLNIRCIRRFAALGAKMLLILLTLCGIVPVRAADPSAPTASDVRQVTQKNTATTIVLAATNPNGGSLTYTIATQPTHGALSGTAPYLTYTPTTDYIGTDSFTYYATNSAGLQSNTATATITVNNESFVVTTAADEDNGTTDSTQGTGTSLREVLNYLNSLVGTYQGNIQITFNIPGPAPHVITPTSPLPALLVQCTVNGFSQPDSTFSSAPITTNGYDASYNPTIVLDGSSAGAGANGLTVSVVNNTIRGFRIRNFSGSGIAYVPVVAATQTIGGNLYNCVLSGNKEGITATDARINASGNLVFANTIGVHIVRVKLPSTPGSLNVFQDNLIGTDGAGTGGSRATTGNTLCGVLIEGSAVNYVSSAGSSENVIAYSGSDAIRVQGNTAIGNYLRLNRYFGNGGLPINLVGGTEDSSGFTANDAGDADSGPNGLQNSPVISRTSTSSSPNAFLVTLNSKPNTTYTLDIYGAEDAQDPAKTVFTKGVSITTNSAGTAISGPYYFGAPTKSTLYLVANVTNSNTNVDGTSEMSPIFRAQYDAVQTGPEYIVNATRDGNDGFCTADDCTLREAITAANNDSRFNTISFNIAGTGVQSIKPTSALPALTQPFALNGYSQPGATANTSNSGFNASLPIVLDGSLLSAGTRGLTVTASNWTIKGLKVQNFKGVIPSGQTNAGAPAAGIAFLSPTTSTLYSDGSVQGCWLVGNTIGVLVVDSDKALIGGSDLASRNLLQTNNEGVALSRINLATNGNLVKGNLFGTDLTGIGGSSTTTGNGGAIYVDGASGTTIGGSNLEANTITNSIGDGIRIGYSVTATGGTGTVPASGTSIAPNSIFSNGRLGINLVPSGESNASGTAEVTPNDVGDADTGPNGLQNFPVLLAATGSVVRGTLNTTPNTSAQIVLFSSPVANPSGYGEGQTFLTAYPVSTDGSGNVTFTIPVGKTLPAGQVITAIATTAAGSSEFCQALPVTADTGLIISEFRMRGSSENDEYIELYNTSSATLNVGGWQVQYSSNGATQTVSLPAGTTIPGLGHYLLGGSAYSLANYGGVGAATLNQSLASPIDDGSSLTMRNPVGVARDAVTFGSDRLPSAPTANGEYAFVRQPDLTTSLPVTTANAFTFVATDAGNYAGTNGTLTAALGAPGPENLASPRALLPLKVTLLDPAVAQSVSPNRVRVGAGASGTLSIRRLVTNNTGAAVTQLRFRIVNLSTLNSAGYSNSAQADFRSVASGFSTQSVATSSGNVTVYGTTPDTSIAQSLGGGINSTTLETASGVVTLSAPLGAGATRAYDFTFNVVRPGNFTILILFEELNGTTSSTSVAGTNSKAATNSVLLPNPTILFKPLAAR